MIKKKKKVYKRAGYKSKEWKRLKKAVEKSLFCKKENYYKRTVASLKGAAKKNWHRRMKVLMDSEPTKKWKVQDLWPEKNKKDVAELLAEHFNRIARDFEKLDVNKIPRTYDAPILDLHVS